MKNRLKNVIAEHALSAASSMPLNFTGPVRLSPEVRNMPNVSCFSNCLSCRSNCLSVAILPLFGPLEGAPYAPIENN